MTKPKKRNPETAARVKRTSELTGVSKRTVYRVIEGIQKNEEVLRVYMQLQEGENLLLQAARKLVPFPSKKLVTQ